MRVYDEDDLVTALKGQLNQERDIDQAKIDLTNRPDFNLFDAFRIFDIDNRGYVLSSDLKYGLNDLGVFPSQDDLDLFF